MARCMCVHGFSAGHKLAKHASFQFAQQKRHSVPPGWRPGARNEANALSSPISRSQPCIDHYYTHGRMVFPPEENPVRNPLEFVKHMYSVAGSPASGSEFNLSEQLRRLLQERDLLSQVPLLTYETAQHLPNQSLVRFQGMVQDMADPQYYYGSVQLSDGTWQTTKYGDQVPQHTPQSATRIWERRPLYCVPIPGRSAWTKPNTAAMPNTSEEAQGSHKKRGRGDEDRMDSDHVTSSAASEPVPQAAPEARAEGGAARAQPAKVSRTQESSGGTGNDARAGNSHDVRPGDCIVHAYDVPDGHLCLHDIVEVVGVLSHAPELVAWHMGEDEEQAHDNEMGGHNASDMCEQEVPRMLQNLSINQQATSQVMRVHAILITRNPSLHPSAPAPVTAAQAPVTAPAQAATAEPAPAAAPATAAADVSSARAAAVKMLSRCLCGDELAAEYVLLASLARVTSRPVDGSQSVVGMMPLNLTRCPAIPPATPATPATATPATTAPGAPSPAAPATGKASPSSPIGEALHETLSELLPMAAYLPLTVDSCNSGSGWVPKRDSDTGRVSRSPLQLPRGCMLVVDEITLGEGRLNETGIRSLQALHGLLQDQVLGYDFEFCTGHPFPVEVPAVVLSEGRSLLHNALALTLPLERTQPTVQVSGLASQVDPQTLDAVRSYLAASAQTQYTIGDEMIEMLQQEFVSARKSNATGFSAEAFQLRLTVARLSALSWGESSLTLQRWKAAQQMEEQRQQRTVTKTK